MEHLMLNAPIYMPDEQIEFWAEIYLAMPRLRGTGVSFERFLRTTPQVREVELLPAVLALCGGKALSAITRSALIELAEAAIAQLEREGALCSNGRFVEKLRHHRHPRSYRDFIPGR
jgi:hypothetical protein